MADFTSHERWNEERIGALALYCCDGRWGEAFDDFCHRRLLIPRYDRWAVPGGPAWLIPRANGPDCSQATREQLDFLVRVHELERIILITHYGCAYYGELFHKTAEECLPIQMEEACTAAELLRKALPGLTIEPYLAMRIGQTLSFHHLGEAWHGKNGATK
jgi:hypothetical protein